MTVYKAPFQFQKSRVVEFEIKDRKVKDYHGRLQINIGIDYEISDVSKANGTYEASLNLFIKLQGLTEKQESVFTIQLNIQGDFSCGTDQLPKEAFTDMVELNGLNTLMQMSRAYITAVTSLSGFASPITLPLFNLFDIIKNKKREIIKNKKREIAGKNKVDKN